MGSPEDTPFCIMASQRITRGMTLSRAPRLLLCVVYRMQKVNIYLRVSCLSNMQRIESIKSFRMRTGKGYLQVIGWK